MRGAVVAMTLGLAACADEPPAPEPEPWPAPMPAIPKPDAMPPDAAAIWNDVAVLRWPAPVVRASGIEVEEPCFVEALTDGPRFRRITVVCGAQTLFDSDHVRYGGPVEGATLRERAMGDWLVHGLVADHTAGGVHLSVATREETATVEQDGWFGWSLQLRPIAWTEGRRDPALLVPNTVESRAAVLHLSVAGDAGALDPGAVCRVDVRIDEALGAALECGVAVECGEIEVFGPTTKGPCSVEGGALTSVEVPGDAGAPSFAWTAAEAKGSIVVDGRRVSLEGNVGSIGIRECDEYLATYRGCLGHFPEAARASMESALESTEDAWKQAAAGPGRSYLASSCEAARDAMRTTLSSYGCGF